MTNEGLMQQIRQDYQLLETNRTVTMQVNLYVERDRKVTVRCRDCTSRLFDVLGVRFATRYGRENAPGRTPLGPCYKLQRKCRSRRNTSCGRLNDHIITLQPGEPVTKSERWLCENRECGGYLGYIDASRGRFDLRCRCGQDHNIVVPNLLCGIGGIVLMDPSV